MLGGWLLSLAFRQPAPSRTVCVARSAARGAGWWSPRCPAPRAISIRVAHRLGPPARIENCRCRIGVDTAGLVRRVSPSRATPRLEAQEWPGGI